LESVAENTDVILPPEFMETVKDAIRRDGLALARVPPNFEAELTKYGGTDPIEALKFRFATFPRDTSSWKILEVALLTMVRRIESRINLANSIGIDPQLFVFYDKTEVNGYREILYTLLRRIWQSFMEITVLFTLLNYSLEFG
jgi:hypothetical protein